MFPCLKPFLNEMVGASTSRGWSMRKRDQKRIATCLPGISNAAWLAVSMVKTRGNDSFFDKIAFILTTINMIGYVFINAGIANVDIWQSVSHTVNVQFHFATIGKPESNVLRASTHTANGFSNEMLNMHFFIGHLNTCHDNTFSVV